MGISKAMMEKVMVAKSRSLEGSGTVVCTTRYGNVMASRGSVIPLFVRQIREGRPLTVTDPSMTRFLMSLDDAVDLVLFAYEHAAQGDSFILKAPAGTMQDLAEAVQIVCGSNLPVEVIGTRHGEKLYETLVSREEMVRAVEVANCFRVPSDTRDLNYGKFVTDGEQTISTADDYTSHNTRRLTVDEIVATLRGLDYFRRPAGWDEGGVD
jgi:UDP-glucose 4-epimerase